MNHNVKYYLISNIVFSFSGEREESFRCNNIFMVAFLIHCIKNVWNWFMSDAEGQHTLSLSFQISCHGPFWKAEMQTK